MAYFLTDIAHTIAHDERIYHEAKTAVFVGGLFSRLSMKRGYKEAFKLAYDRLNFSEALKPFVGPLRDEIVATKTADAILIADDIAQEGGMLLHPDAVKCILSFYRPLLGDLRKQDLPPIFFHSDGDFTMVYHELFLAGFEGVHLATTTRQKFFSGFTVAKELGLKVLGGLGAQTLFDEEHLTTLKVLLASNPKLQLCDDGSFTTARELRDYLSFAVTLKF